MSMDKLEAERHRLRRLRILQTVNMNRPNPMGEGLLAQVLKGDTDLAFTHSSIRKGLDYLDGRKLIVITTKENDLWSAKTTPDGVDYLDGIGEDIAGVARPGDF